MYNPSNWYWIKSNGDVYSSAARAKIKSDDANFVDWKAASNAPTPWPKDASGKESDTELDLVLSGQGIASNLVAVKTVIPEFVTLAQARAALMDAGLFVKVDTFIKASGNALAAMAWEYTNNVSRNGALVKALAPAAGLTDAQLDQLFIKAANIQM
jgi:hypothetical protein